MSRDQRRHESKIDSYDAPTGVWIPAFAGMTMERLQQPGSLTRRLISAEKRIGS